MNTVFTILNKVLVREFYRSNASFFLVVIGLAAGFMRSYEHIALAEFFISSPFLLLIPILVWTLYTLKVIRFNLDALSRSENEFLYNISLLPKKEEWFVLVGTAAAQLIPVILYGLFLFLMAWKNNVTLMLGLTSVTCVILILLTSLSLFMAFNRPNVQKSVWALTNFINSKFTKPYFLFFPEWIIRREALMFFGTKVFSVLILYGVTQLYKTDQYDLRLLGMGVVVGFSANVNLVWEMHRFDNFHFGIMRNLPIRYVQRLGYFMATLTLLLLPEVGIIIKNSPITFSLGDLISAILFGVSFPILFYGCLYIKDKGQEKLTTIVFFTDIALIILILFKVPLLILGIVNLAVGLWIWNSHYYSFEYVQKTDTTKEVGHSK